MRRAIHVFRQLVWEEEEAQATVEYMILLMMVVTLFLSLFRGVLLPALSQVSTILEQNLIQRLSRGVHQFRVR